MKTFFVGYTIVQLRSCEVEAENEDDAREQFFSGNIYKDEEIDTQETNIENITPEK